MAFFDNFLTPKAPFWGPWGVILAPFGSILVALGTPGDARGDPLGSKVDFGWILGTLGVPLGGHFGIIFFNIFCVFLVSKVAVGLQTCFLSCFEVEKSPQRRASMWRKRSKLRGFSEFSLFEKKSDF